MKKSMILAVCFTLLLGTAGLHAGIEDGYVFSFAGEKQNWNNGKITEYGDLLGLSEFVFWENETPGLVNLTFRLTEDNESGKWNQIQPDHFGLEGFDTLLDVNSGSWNNFQGGSIAAPATREYTFATNVLWDAFVEAITDEDFGGYILAHIQNLGDPIVGNSLQTGVFKYSGLDFDNSGGGDGCEDNPFADGCDAYPTPEPGSILLLGTGIVGLGIIARRKMTSK